MRSERHHRLPCVTGICFPNILLKPQDGPIKKKNSMLGIKVLSRNKTIIMQT